MAEVVIGVCAAFAGFWFASLLRGSRAQAEMAPVAAPRALQAPEMLVREGEE